MDLDNYEGRASAWDRSSYGIGGRNYPERNPNHSWKCDYCKKHADWAHPTCYGTLCCGRCLRTLPDGERPVIQCYRGDAGGGIIIFNFPERITSGPVSA